MRVKTFYRVLRFISAVVLFFHVWTFGPLWQAVAFAAGEKQGPGARVQGPERQGTGAGVQGPGERFEKTIEDIREKVDRAGERSRKGEEPVAELQFIKAKKTEIEALDAELKSDFAVTETKLKDAHLSGEILERHHKFVKHYQNNLKELIANLEQVERAQTKAEVEVKVKKAKEHLDKVKKPSTHKKIDPNKLPQRTVKAKPKAPRLTPAEYQRDFPQHKTNSKQKIAASRFLPDIQTSRAQHKPVLLAFNETASDVPLTLGVQPPTPQFAFADSPLFLLAQQTADLPSADDLMENTEIQFTPEIRAKAQELGYSPVKIYEYVRNNIEFVPTYGSIQGADMCLQTKHCNDFDTASLLIALLRASNLSARYVYGTIEVPIDKVMNWVGGFTDPRAAITLIASGGIPIKPYTSGGVINKVQIEHVSVEAYVSYGPFSGRPSNLNADKIWVPLDPSYKQYTYTQGIDIQSAVPFDAQSVVNQIQSTATMNPDGSVTNVNSTLIQQTMQDYQLQVLSYIQQNKPNATAGDITGKKEIKKQELGILPVTLPYKTVTAGVKYSEIPDNLRHKISIDLLDENGSISISVMKALSEVAGKKLTLSYSPATSADETTLLHYVNPSKASNLPVYLINLKPELRIDGQLIATGASVGMGKSVPFNISLLSPTKGTTFLSNNNTVGTYTAVVLDLGITTASQLDKIKASVTATKAKLDANELTGITKDDVMGEFLHCMGLSYWGMLDVSNKMSAQLNAVVDLRMPSEGTFTYDLKPSYLFDMPISAMPSGFMTDIDADQHVVVAKDGLVSKEVSYMAQIGMLGSRMEASVYDLTFNKAYTGKGITTAHIFEYANQQGIPLYTIDSSNLNTVLPSLTLPADVIADIQNAVNAGKVVTVPKTTVSKDGWAGAGYLIFDRTTGSGAYKISGGLSGGGYTCQCFGLDPQFEYLVMAVLGIAALVATALGLAIAPALVAIAAIVGILMAAIDLYHTICVINTQGGLTEDQLLYAKLIAVGLYLLATFGGILFAPAAVVGIVIFFITFLGNAILENLHIVNPTH